jgi:succinyl-CoA synthetase beta subunit
LSLIQNSAPYAIRWAPKQLLARYAIPVPKDEVAGSSEEAMAAPRKLGGSLWVVSAQVRAGGRDRADAKKLVKPASKAAKLAAAKAELF